jgi:hypothetical protein
MRARETGKRVAVYVVQESAGREGHLIAVHRACPDRLPESARVMRESLCREVEHPSEFGRRA